MNGRHAIPYARTIPSTIALALLLMLWLPVAGAHPRYDRADVSVDVVSNDGRRFATYPAHSESHDVRRAWLEARHREPYRIRVRNRSAQRVGLVIAVDGRNIISGARSELAPDERMYVLEPWEGAEYEGWRTSSERVNEFYFTDWPDSYAEAFGDRSARGVIAVAVYGERHAQRQRERYVPDSSGPSSDYDRYEGKEPEARRGSASRSDRSAPQSAPAPAASDAARSEKSAGTGFGDEVHSPVRIVRFEAERSPAARHFIKYEWRDRLCRMSVIDCDGSEPNRFWPDDRFGYAPYPPGRGRR